jgi:putative endonuclease
MGLRNNQLGAIGETVVAEWYVHQGFEVLDRNWRDGRRGELDLVLGADELVVFCEVKTRSSGRMGNGVEAITPAKMLRLRQLGSAWCRLHAVPFAVTRRFDIAAITGNEFAMYTNVF